MNEVMAIYAKCPSRTVLRRIGFTLFLDLAVFGQTGS